MKIRSIVFYSISGLFSLIADIEDLAFGQSDESSGSLMYYNHPISDTPASSPRRSEEQYSKRTKMPTDSPAYHQDNEYGNPRHIDPLFDENPRPSWEAPVEDKVRYERPNYDRPDYDAPKLGQESIKKPVYEKDFYISPVYDKPKYEDVHDKAPAYIRPTMVEQVYKAPNYDHLNDARQAYEKPETDRSSLHYDRPTYDGPVYNPQEYKPPREVAPAYIAPPK